MKKEYISPDLEIIKFTLSRDVLRVSEDESGTASGYIHDPDDEEELIDDGL